MKRSVKWVLGTGAAVALLAAINDGVTWTVGPTPRWVDGEPHFYQWRDGAVYYEVAGPEDAPPLLLVHGFNAAASSYEFRKVFQPLAQNYRVYLPDLLGYGRSERPPIEYTSDTFIDLWNDFARDVVRQPVHIVASSLSCAHVVAAAARHPERFAKLILICPTGVRSLVAGPGVLGTLFHWLVRSPVVGTAFFNFLVSRPLLAYYLRERVYADRGLVDEALLDDYYTVSHQPGAKWAPASFVSAYLNCDISSELQRLPNPMQLVWGADAGFTPPRRALAFLELRPELPLEVLSNAGLLVAEEQPEAFLRLAMEFLGK